LDLEYAIQVTYKLHDNNNCATQGTGGSNEYSMSITKNETTYSTIQQFTQLYSPPSMSHITKQTIPA